jgi:2-dehydro-3-deoxygluconokinase
MEHDLVALGETMVALAPPGGGSLRTAGRWLADHAGAESNTCVGLARLGLHVAWVSSLGMDAPGDRILDALRSERVDVTWVRRDRDRPTGLMLKEPGTRVQYYRSGSAAGAMGPDILEGVPVSAARAVFVSGVTALIGAAPHAAGLSLLDSSRGLRIVDPNLRHGLWGSDRRGALVRPFIERCDLLLAGADEIREICSGAGEEHARSASSAEALARLAARLGPREVVVRAETIVGVLAVDAWTALEIRRESAVDPIGAGDAFNAGYIASRLRGGTIDAALRAGMLCGAAVTTSVSDTAGFPRALE